MINLYSDTQTVPTENMRKAIANAEVGDEHSRSDPTTLLLENKVAELLGKEEFNQIKAISNKIDSNNYYSI